MLFHEALHLVFTTFSRQVLQQGRLTNYLADCAVFDTFDDRRTICFAIDHHYGARLYTCLSHSPYKQQFDAILTEVRQLHPTINPQQVEYVFQAIRFAWGKIKSVRPPKPPILFAPPKKKRRSRTSQKRRPTPKKHPSLQGGVRTNLYHTKKRQRRPTRVFIHYSLHPTQQIHWKALLKSIGFGLLQIVLYVVLVQCLIGGFVFLIEGRWYGIIGWLIGGIILYILHRKYNP